MDAATPTVFCLKTNRLIDVVRKGETAATALRRLNAYGPHLTILTLADAQDRYEAQFKTEPVEIAEDTWHQALCVLSPEDWRSDAGGDSFKSPERMAGAVTAIYVRINDRHFTFCDDASTPHADCLKRVARSPAWRSKSEGSER